MAASILSSIIRRMINAMPASAGSGLSSSSPHQLGLHEELSALGRTLSRIQAELEDAEEREIREERVKVWLKELKEISNLAEDALAEYNYELLRVNAEMGNLPRPAAGKRKLEEETQVQVPNGVGSKIKEISMRFHELAEQRKDLRLTENDGERRALPSLNPPPSIPYVDESSVFGREEDKEKMVELLVSEKAGAGNLSVIPIIGMGGIGKTTLARLVYKDPMVCQSFNLRVWISVSVDFDVLRIYKAIIESITHESCDLTELSSLQSVLKEELKGKRLLLVLDDVWIEDMRLWESLRVAFVGGGLRRILVTTTNESVARIMQTVLPFRLAGLNEDQGWLLFKHYAFNYRDPESSHPDLVEIGKRIVEKCHGLPLAVKALACLLRFEEDKCKWKDILQSDLWELEEEDGVLPALRLSYHRLPTYLKPCFMYCALFPKNYLFERDELIKLWMAQGLIPFMENRRAEDIGRQYFDDLLRRSFFHLSKIDENELPAIRSSLKLSLIVKDQLLQQTSFIISQYEEHKLFLMHDLICDLARSIVGEECCVKKDAKVNNITSEACHLSLIPSDAKAMTIKLEPVKDEYRKIRSLFFVNANVKTSNGHLSGDYFNVRLSSNLFQKLSCLRVIDLSYTGIKDLPSSIGDLKLLCYLSLQGTKIKSLPNSLSNLYYLQTLDLKYCTSLGELPKGILKLINLRHLILPTKNFEARVGLPAAVGTLSRLQTLSAFNVSDCCRISELKQLKHLQGQLAIAGLQNVTSGKEASLADLKNKEHLRTLALTWSAKKINQASSSCVSNEPGSDRANLSTGRTMQTTQPSGDFVADDILQKLEPHRNLRHLILQGYSGMRFPSWLGDPSFSRLVSVTLSKCHGCKILPPLGQLQFLDALLIGSVDRVEHVSHEFCSHSTASSSKAFPVLSLLCVVSLDQWVEWTGVEDGDFPCLHRLVIKHCSKLIGLPLLPASLETIEMEDVEAITSLPKLPSLKSLDLRGRWNEKLWTSTLELQSLHSLEISESDLSVLHLHGSLDSLKKLDVSDCLHLTSVVQLHELSTLEQLTLYFLPKFVFSSDDCLPPTLQCLIITSCTNLISLPLNQPLPFLQELSIVNCEQLASLTGLQNLNSLKILKLDVCPELCFASDDVLPPTLHYLEISSCDKLNVLSFPQGNLSVLKELTISACKQLTNVVGFGNLTTLEVVEISFCPELHFSPDEQLPSSSLDIEIVDCPGLTEWCQRNAIIQDESGDDWEDEPLENEGVDVEEEI